MTIAALLALLGEAYTAYQQGKLIYDTLRTELKAAGVSDEQLLQIEADYDRRIARRQVILETPPDAPSSGPGLDLSGNAITGP